MFLGLFSDGLWFILFDCWVFVRLFVLEVFFLSFNVLKVMKKSKELQE